MFMELVQKRLQNIQQEINSLVSFVNEFETSKIEDDLITNNCKDLDIKQKLLLQVAPDEIETNKKCPCCKVVKHKADYINKNCTKINKTCNYCV